MMQAVEEGPSHFIEAMAVFDAHVRPLPGRPHGILAEGERAVATRTELCRRMGHPGSEVNLASPAVAAAYAIKARLTDRP
jgi:3-isopropylmalate/(R)-2-methylmalate dehydratase large subunit